MKTRQEKFEEMDISEFGLIAAISKTQDCTDEDFDNIVQILDKNGSEVNLTQENIIEEFDIKGISSFIL